MSRLPYRVPSNRGANQIAAHPERLEAADGTRWAIVPSPKAQHRKPPRGTRPMQFCLDCRTPNPLERDLTKVDGRWTGEPVCTRCWAQRQRAKPLIPFEFRATFEQPVRIGSRIIHSIVLEAEDSCDALSQAQAIGDVATLEREDFRQTAWMDRALVSIDQPGPAGARLTGRSCPVGAGVFGPRRGS